MLIPLRYGINTFKLFVGATSIEDLLSRKLYLPEDKHLQGNEEQPIENLQGTVRSRSLTWR